MSSLVTLLSSIMEPIEDRIDAMATNGIRCGTRSAIVGTLSHFPELKTELELLGSGSSIDLTED
jgi:hypothetical protein